MATNNNYFDDWRINILYAACVRSKPVGIRQNTPGKGIMKKGIVNDSQRLFVVVMTACFVLAVCSPVFADPAEGVGEAGSVLLVDAYSGQVIFEKNADEAVEFAGLKRLPALLAVCRAFDEGAITPDSAVTVSEKAAEIRGATAFLSANERILADDVLKAAVILNAGDAVCTLIEAVFGNEAAALEDISRELKGLGVGYVPEDALGGSSPISARDIALIGMELAKSEAYLKYSSVYLDSITHENGSVTELTNPNRLVRHYSGCYGLATGSVGSSDYAGAFIARRGNSAFLAVVSGMRSAASRAKLASALLDHAFSSYRRVELGAAGETVGAVLVSGGMLPSVEARTAAPVSALVPVGDTKLTSYADLPEAIEAPVEEGALLGTLLIKNSAGETIGEVPLVASANVEKAGLVDIIVRIFRSFVHADK
jgi:D-alanyl-D-alanine carboxypeptidase (penicillin-binding protein 5/6)